MNRSTFCEIKFMNVFFSKGQVYDWGWFKILTRTSVPKLPQNGPKLNVICKCLIIRWRYSNHSALVPSINHKLLRTAPYNMFYNKL